MIQLDGSSGGGQMLRSALAFSLITQQPFEMYNIRASRPKPGLQPQHKTCIDACCELFDARCEGKVIGSTKIIFHPGPIKKKRAVIDIGTAGSITLLLQSLLLALLHSKEKISLTIKGGTDVQWSMPYDYFENVYLPMLRPYGKIDAKLVSRGFYPKGKGEIKLNIKGNNCTAPFVRVQQGKRVAVKIKSIATKDFLPAEVAERMATSCTNIFSDAHAQKEYVDSASSGAVVSAWAIFSLRDDECNMIQPIILGADVLGERGIPSEKIGALCAEKLSKEISSGAAVDAHLADNLIPLLALYGGEILTSEITDHVNNNIKVCKQFVKTTFEIDGRRIRGILKNT